ncbi:hypothetical protein D3C86_1443810 [compost metagenome]
MARGVEGLDDLGQVANRTPGLEQLAQAEHELAAGDEAAQKLVGQLAAVEAQAAIEGEAQAVGGHQAVEVLAQDHLQVLQEHLVGRDALLGRLFQGLGNPGHQLAGGGALTDAGGLGLLGREGLGVHPHHAGHDDALGDGLAPDEEAVTERREGGVVAELDPGDHPAHLLGELDPEHDDAVHQGAARARIDQADQLGADLHPDGGGVEAQEHRLGVADRIVVGHLLGDAVAMGRGQPREELGEGAAQGVVRHRGQNS